MKTRILLVICCVLVSQSCTKTVGVLEENSVNTEYSIITIEQALNNLSRFLSEVDMNQTREGEYRKIKTIDTYSDQLSTRSEENLPQAYIVNYENDGGFAILGANTGVFPIINHFPLLIISLIEAPMINNTLNVLNTGILRIGVETFTSKIAI